MRNIIFRRSVGLNLLSFVVYNAHYGSVDGAVLALSAVAEGYSLMVAYKHMKETAKRNNMGLWEAIQKGRCVVGLLPVRACAPRNVSIQRAEGEGDRLERFPLKASTNRFINSHHRCLIMRV